MTDPESRLVGGHRYAFRWIGGRLEPLARDTGPALTGDHADVDVQVNIYRAADRMICGEVVVSTVLTGNPANRDYQRLNTLGESDQPVHIDSAVWRRIPIGELVGSTVEGLRETLEKYVRDRMLGDINYEPFEQAVNAEPPKRRPGPRSSLTTELLADVVAPAYRAGGDKPVEAVRRALEAAGYPGSAADGHVTIDQARKAVKAARSVSLIPPAERRGARR